MDTAAADPDDDPSQTPRPDHAPEVAAARARSAVAAHGSVLGAGAIGLRRTLTWFSRVLGGRLVLAVEALADGLDGLGRQRRADVARWRAEQAATEARAADLEKIVAQVAALGRENRAEIDLLRRELGALRAGTAPRDATPVPTGELVVAATAPPLDDVTYLAFEERFRGSWREIEARQHDALSHVVELADGTRPLLDLGSGRGEWLAVLATARVPAYGVDANGAMAARAHDAGLDVRVGDALEHLDQVDAGSLGAVTAFHLAEHLPIADLHRLLVAAFRAIEPGGLLLLETPDPTNLGVGAASFYLDPTHLRPLHPLFLQFLVSNAGFEDVTVHKVHPVDAELARPVGGDSSRDRLLDTLAEAIFGGQDYLIVARRPGVRVQG